MARKPALHEQFDRPQDIKAGTERGFGIVFCVVFTVIGLWPLTGGTEPRWWSLAVAAVFIGLGLLLPRALRPLHAVWFRFGMVLHAVVTPIVMGLIFYVAVLPTGLMMRAFGKDPMNRRFDPSAATYWQPRTPPGPDPDTMRNQF